MADEKSAREAEEAAPVKPRFSFPLSEFLMWEVETMEESVRSRRLRSWPPLAHLRPGR